MPDSTPYDVAIVGAGICGSALAHVLSRYTDVRRIAVLEKCEGPAEINSAHWNNSQTLHVGDIETNYSLDKAREVKRAAEMVRRYLERNDDEHRMHQVLQKMVIGVGEEEVERLRQRHEEFQQLFPELQWLKREDIAELEPAVIEGRDPDEPIAALHIPEGHSVDYGRLAQSFLEQAREDMKSAGDREQSDRELDIRYQTEVQAIEALEDGRGGYCLDLGEDGKLQARFLVVAAGGHSLLMAKQLGHGKNLGLLSVAGSFYHAEDCLKGKVYTMQIKELPFAAPHGDAEVHEPQQTRFGPTAKPLPMLERHQYGSIGGYFRTLDFNWATFASLVRILCRPILLRFAIMNALYEVPWLGKRLFLRQLRKIVPKLKPGDIQRARGIGGVRPQIVDTEARDLDLGEARIEGEHAIFNVTPSPGASVCLRLARDDAETITKTLECRFDSSRFDRELGESGSSS
ncbi:MAG: FAD-dependent oxidoreductase [Akkermansiaceae bacterium]|nr:FAD-dependent oxidoreductase [Akkermansiaceae bacterium]